MMKKVGIFPFNDSPHRSPSLKVYCQKRMKSSENVSSSPKKILNLKNFKMRRKKKHFFSNKNEFQMLEINVIFVCIPFRRFKKK